METAQSESSGEELAINRCTVIARSAATLTQAITEDGGRNMHWRKRVTEDLEISNRVLGFATLVCCVMLIVICSIDAAGQYLKDQQPPKAAAAPGTKLITLPIDTI